MSRLRNISILLFSLLLGCAASPHAEDPSDQKRDFFLETASVEKMSPSLQKRLRELEATGGGAERLDLLLGLKAAPTEAEKNRLRQDGALLRSIVGAIAAATVPAGRIPAISRLDFVETLEPAASFGQKGDGDEEP